MVTVLHVNRLGCIYILVNKKQVCFGTSVNKISKNCIFQKVLNYCTAGTGIIQIVYVSVI